MKYHQHRIISKTGSTKILTLEIASFLFTLVDVICEFVYILLPPRKKRKMRYTIFHEDTYLHIQRHTLIKNHILCQGYC